MEKVISFKPHTSFVSDTSLVQRGVYFLLGFGLILTAVIDPPVTATWMAIANTLGTGLVLLAILGKRLLPEMKGSGVLHEPRVLTNSFGVMLGLGLSIFAIAQPPVATIWAAYAHTVAVILVTHALLGFEFLLASKSSQNVGQLQDRINKSSVPKEHLPTAA